MKAFCLSLFSFLTLIPSFWAHDKPNILFITLDDMNWDSMGAYGCKVPEITPHMDSLARQGMRFEHAYVQSPNCSPSRNVFQSGRYPHTSGLVGFYNVKPDFKTLPEVLRENGYITGVLNKPRDTSMNSNYDQFWDHYEVLKADRKRNANSYRSVFEQFLGKVREESKPFYCVVNIADPHKPFFGDPSSKKQGMDDFKPSRIYQPSEVAVPPFLPEYKGIREEIANYYNSVKRGDDCIGAVLEAFRESEFAENTVVMLISDHGMAVPFAKSSLYPNGVKTPWLVVWPNKVKANTVDRDHMISAIDFMPTILDIVGIKQEPAVDGKSFLPILMGERQDGRDQVFVEFNENAGGNPSPMRAVLTKEYCYVFNPWSNGERKFLSASNYHTSYKVMAKNSKNNAEVKQRFEHLNYRCLEELYDVNKDPHALNNLVNNPEFEPALRQMRNRLVNHMQSSQDDVLEAFHIKEDQESLEIWFKQEDEEAQKRAETIEWKRHKNRAGGTGKNTELFVK